MEPGKVDLHCHLAYGVSDGPPEPEISLRMIDAAEAAGVRYINAVAHSGPWFDEVRAAVEFLRGRTGGKIELHPGVEYDFDDLSAAEFVPVTVGDDSPFFLLDFNSRVLPPEAGVRLAELAARGYRAIVVHPEVLFGPSEVATLAGLRESGALFQLNAASFLPEASGGVRNMAVKLLEAELGDMIASDAHRDRGRRRYAIAEAGLRVSKRFGAEAAETLFSGNPARVLRGEEPERPRLRRRKFFGLFS